ncbi:hypothetical protein [Streptomyces cavernae]|uniref:hypothetical protein n=1 Tax=Streptomyces cavernae TaxID=2259034 RepID=UPI000FEBB95E|nr:hypothetical protein [Streptomyces cavernae]
MRSTAGRRVTQVVLLLGGLVTLGFIWGGQAQADSGGASSGIVPSAKSAVEQVVRPVVNHRAAPGQPLGNTKASSGSTDRSEVQGVVRRADDRVVQPVRDGVARSVEREVERSAEGATRATGAVRPAGDEVVRPVGDLVERVSGEVADVPAHLPALSALPRVPGIPGIPGMPGIPGLPELPDIPEPLPPVVTNPHPGDGTGGPGGKADSATRSEEGSRGAAPASYGPQFTGGWLLVPSAHARPSGSPQRDTHRPARQAPGEDPAGALGGRSAVDNGSTRHSDAHAVSFDQHMTVRLAYGAVARAAAHATRERHQDIPEFPG